MKKLLVIAGILLISFSLASQARSSGGGGSPSGGSSSSHISSEGLKNTNGPNSADRDTGLDRAEDRMNKEGLSHEQATDNVGKKDKNKRKSKNRHRRQGTDNDKAK